MTASSRSRRRARLALAALRLYPRPWRRRYEDELRLVIEEHGATSRDVVDLAWGAVREQWRGPNGPDPGERPIAAAFWRGTAALLRRLVVWSSLATAAYGAGWLIGLLTGPLPDSTPLFLGLMALGALVFVCARGLYGAYKTARLLPALPPPPRSPFPQRLAQVSFALCLACVLLLGIGHEVPPLQFYFSNFWWLVYPTFDRAFYRDGRHRRIADASRNYFGAREMLKHARIELARLESLNVPEDATAMLSQRATITKLQDQMAAAVEILRHPDRALEEDASRVIS
jgi:hypothetical protein